MRGIRWVKRAENKLQNSLEFWIEHNKSNDYAIKIKDEITKAQNTLIEFPYIGRETEIKGVRRLLVMRRFILFYTISDKEICIVAFKEAKKDI